MKNQNAKTYIVLIVGMIAISFGSILVRLADAPSLIIAAYRLVIATIVLSPIALLKHTDEIRTIRKRDLVFALLAGFFLGLHLSLWISSLQYTTVASSVILVDTNPIFVGIVSYLFLKETLTRELVLGIFLSVVGAVVIGFGDFSISGTALLGDMLALGGAIMGSAYYLSGRILRRRLSLVPYIFLVYGAAGLIVVVLSFASGQSFVGYSIQTYLMLFLLAIVPQILGHSSFNWALKYLSASLVSVAILAEPIGATILAYVILGEVPSVGKIIGGIIILAGIYFASVGESIVRQQAPTTSNLPAGE